MILIAHRGNTEGRKPKRENQPSYITTALEAGHYCEIDVWLCEKTFLLGHDKPTHKVDEPFLENDKFICHAKNPEAFHKMLLNPKIHCFFHDKDDCALTSRGWVWKFPEIYYNGQLYAICSDRL